MGRDDWYRNKHWDQATEEAFRAKLSRARSSRSQYLLIQAGCLSKSYPAVALKLTDEYIESGLDFQFPSAMCVRADACCSLGDVEGAIAAYKQALDWESDHPNFITNARLSYAVLVAKKQIISEYDSAMKMLADRFKPSDHQFHSTRYYWNGSCALISHALGHRSEAKEFAERALRAASETESSFRYHRDVGVVRDTSDDFGRRVKRIARPSVLRSLFRII